MRLLSSVVVFSLLYLPSLKADTLYDNGAVTGSVYAWDITGSTVANSFSLTSNSTLTGLSFGTWSTEPGITPIAPSRVSWEISSTPFQSASTAFATGTASITATFLGYDKKGLGLDIFLDSINLPNISLTAGNYWIALFSATNGTTNPVYWDQAVNGKSHAYISDQPLVQISSEAFQFNGAAFVIPQPGTLWLLSAGFLGWLVISRHHPRRIGHRHSNQSNPSGFGVIS